MRTFMNRLFLVLALVILPAGAFQCRMCRTESSCSTSGSGVYSLGCTNPPSTTYFSCCDDPRYVANSMGSCSAWRINCLQTDLVNQTFIMTDIYCCACDPNCQV